VCTGSSTELVIFMQNERPSDAETRQPFVTFHSSFISSLLDGSRIVSSWTPRGNWPGALPSGAGLCSPRMLRSGSSPMLGE
jgi:hypothetical protein